MGEQISLDPLSPIPSYYNNEIHCRSEIVKSNIPNPCMTTCAQTPPPFRSHRGAPLPPFRTLHRPLIPSLLEHEHAAIATPTMGIIGIKR
ncbi:hypothetical protein JTE90_022332 [Oedothorax gibbosus]|uniref:Uncharacterized protein n=1 Tax=Oedothorax gibbosus TaxID=931172 RepID=A0AAV6VW51_9ARAC|nr:hypothetical protein JTE90_022332 [Oedothorax gibbosus]